MIVQYSYAAGTLWARATNTREARDFASRARPFASCAILRASPRAWGGEVSRGVRHMPNRTVPSPSPGATKH